MPTQSNQNATIESVFRPVLSSLARLARQLRDGRSANGEVDELRDLLETLPMSSEQFALACNHLRNAQRYLQAQEAGAAQWELDALKKQLCGRVDPRPRSRSSADSGDGLDSQRASTYIVGRGSIDV